MHVASRVLTNHCYFDVYFDVFILMFELIVEYHHTGDTRHRRMPNVCGGHNVQRRRFGVHHTLVWDQPTRREQRVCGVCGG